MKKNNIFFMCAAAALVMVSCQKGEDNPQQTDSVPVYLETIEAVSPSVPVRTMTNDGVNILWQDGDRIVLRCHPIATEQPVTCTYTTTLSSPNATATFVRDADQQNNPTLVDNKYVAIYPAALNYSLWSKSPYLTLAPDKDQDVETDGWDPNSSLMIAVSENTEFIFKHIVSYIAFTVDVNTTPFNKISVSSKNSSQEIISRIEVYFDGTHKLVTGKSQCSKTVTFKKSNNSNFAPGTYYIAINPDTYEKGLTVTFENGSSSYEITTPVNVVLEPGEVANLGTIGTLDFDEVVTVELPQLYDKDGVKGVLFWADPTNPTKGKIVSGATTNVKWSSDINIPALDQVAAIDTDDSEANRDYIMALSNYNETNFPAVYFCAQLGEDWYLPSLNELNNIFKTYWGVDALAGDTPGQETSIENAAIFDALLGQCVTDDPETTYNEAKLDYDKTDATWYWTGQGYKQNTSATRIRRAKIQTTYAEGYANTGNECFVRCVRDVEIN